MKSDSLLTSDGGIDANHDHSRSANNEGTSQQAVTTTPSTNQLHRCNSKPMEQFTHLFSIKNGCKLCNKPRIGTGSGLCNGCINWVKCPRCDMHTIKNEAKELKRTQCWLCDFADSMSKCR